MICLVTFFDDRYFSLLNHVKYDSYLMTSQRETVHEHTQNKHNYSFYSSDMPSNNYMTITITVFLFRSRLFELNCNYNFCSSGIRIDSILARDYRQYCHVGDSAQHCRLGKTFNQLRDESYVSVGVEHLSQ